MEVKIALKPKLSARNQLQATVQSIEKQGLMSKITMEVGGQPITAIITEDAANELELKFGDTVTDLIKSTSVMVMKELR